MAGSPQDQPVIEAIKTRISAGDLAGARAACETFLVSVSDSARQSPVRAWLGMVEQRMGALPAAIEQYELALQADRLHRLVPRAVVQRHRVDERPVEVKNVASEIPRRNVQFHGNRSTQPRAAFCATANSVTTRSVVGRGRRTPPWIFFTADYADEADKTFVA